VSLSHKGRSSIFGVILSYFGLVDSKWRAGLLDVVCSSTDGRSNYYTLSEEFYNLIL
jgi:hypothetical protein